MHTVDLSHTPWSMAGSWLHVRRVDASRRLLLGTSRRDVYAKTHDGRWRADFFQVILFKGDAELAYEAAADPTKIDLTVDGTLYAEIFFLDAETVCFRSHDCSVALVPPGSQSWWESQASGRARVFDFEARHAFSFRTDVRSRVNLTHTLAFSPVPARAVSVVLRGEGGNALGAVRCASAEPAEDWAVSDASAQSALGERCREYGEWAKKMPAVPPRYESSAAFAWYMLWNQRVSPRGPITRQAVLMSRNWMNMVWPWDACFSALAIAKADPALAWEQIMLHFDHQRPDGALPDHISDTEVCFGFTKPPVQGWTIRQIIATNGVEASLPYLKHIYKPLSRWTEWWYSTRDTNHDGTCQYMHGNDSGWDNSTVFTTEGPIDSPDLSAFLILQMDVLADVAGWLGQSADDTHWRERSEAALRRLLANYLVDGRFVARRTSDDAIIVHDSLLTSMPIVLGSKLPNTVMKNLLQDLSFSGPYLTQFGLATESTASLSFRPDGYWRGAIWAPPTYLAYFGLQDAGYEHQATALAERFCDMCVASPEMCENFDPVTGKGQCCRAYSWTAAVFILLAEKSRSF